MKILGILRHAKSDWADNALSDHERPLNARGKAAARALGSVLAAERPGFDQVLCSSAARTRETLTLAQEKWSSPLASFEEGLYHAGAVHLLQRVQQLDNRLQAVLLIGHNPGLQDFALTLAGGGDQALLSSLSNKLPTAGLVTLHFAVESWHEIGPEMGGLAGFVTPHDYA